MRLKLPSSQTLKAAGGRVVRTSEARVNGCAARVAVMGFDCPLPEAESSIRRLWNLPAGGVLPFGAGTWLTRVENGIRQDILLLPGGTSATCSAWLVESAPPDGEAPAAPPGGNPLPGATLASCIEMADTGSVLTVHETAGTPAEGARAATAGMEALGWGPLLAGDTTVYFAKDGRAAVAVAYGAADATRVAIFRSGHSKQ